jgi:hypothetical protein
MGTLPPKLQIVGKEAEDNAYKICELMQITLQETATWCESTAIQLRQDLPDGLRDEGLDGGGKLTQLLHGGNASRTGQHIVQPLYVVQTDLLNAARSVVVFGNRIRVEYFDAIRNARRMKTRGSSRVEVV